jgi:hypothetical protein
MAKYIQLEEKQIRALAIQYNLTVDDFAPIEGGAGNTSFLLHTNRGKFVLTVFEISMDRVTVINERSFCANRSRVVENGSKNEL